MEDSLLYTCEKSDTLRQIFSGDIATESIRDSLLNFKETGNSRAEDYIKCCITIEMSMREGQKCPYLLPSLLPLKFLVKNRKNLERKEH